jgi:hypothetical protein
VAELHMGGDEMMGGPDMAPQSTWGPRHGPQTPNARHAPGHPGRSSVLRAAQGSSRDGPPRGTKCPSAFPSIPPPRSE